MGYSQGQTTYTEEKIQARVEASKQLGFEALSTTEQANEISRRTSLKMIQEPKISNEDYLKGNDLKLSILLDTVAMWYAIQAKKLNDKRKTMINDFLEQMRESSP